LIARGDVAVTVTAAPAKHAPNPLGAVLPVVMGSMLDIAVGDERRRRIYVTGETLLHDRLAEIPARFPDIDLCLIHLGGTRIAGILLTMDAQQGVEALRIVDPDEAIPIHYDDYTVFKSPLADFKAAASRAQLRTTIRYVAQGETHRMDLAPRGTAAR
jgi:L-ascorbate metabolism protein UlaG (beta-lactamase superfamily)